MFPSIERRVALALLIATSATRLPPVDQCDSDASFAQFRLHLAQAVQRKDVGFVLESLDEEVLVDFGGSAGKTAFREAWKLENPDRSGLWSELQTILGLGCALVDEVRVIPSLGEQVDPDGDPFEMLLALDGAVLRRSPSHDAPVVAELDWDALALGDEIRDDAWFPARLADGRSGYVRRDQVRSPLDYRMTIEWVGDGWKITTFVAGD